MLDDLRHAAGLVIDHEAGGDNGFGSVRVFVCVFVCLPSTAKGPVKHKSATLL